MVLTKEREAEIRDRLEVQGVSRLDDVAILLSELDSLREQKRLLFEENGRLLEEKESGLWDCNHPLRSAARQPLEALEEAHTAMRWAFNAGHVHPESLVGKAIIKSVKALPALRAALGEEK